MYAYDFEYDGQNLSDYGMIVCVFDSSTGIQTTSSGADITFKQIKPSGSDRFNIHPSGYDSFFTTTFQIGMDPCKNYDDDMYMPTYLVSDIQRWLCRKNEYCKFKIPQEGFYEVYWNATFASRQIELNGKIIGLELTLYTDAPYGFMDEISLSFALRSKNKFQIIDQSDEIGHIYPNVKIKMFENGNLIIKNSMSNKRVIVNNCLNGEIITFDGKNKIITSNLASHTSLQNDFNYVFPTIANTYKDKINQFEVNKQCNIEVRYSPIIKVGL